MLNTRRTEDGLYYLSWAVARKPRSVQHLLLSHGIRLPPHPDQPALIRGLFTGLRGPRFRQALTQMLEQGKGYDSFSEGSSPTMPDIAVGADPVSAVAGAVSSLAHVVGFAQQKKQYQQQQRNQQLKALLAQREQAMHAAPNAQGAEGELQGVAWVAGVGLLVLVILRYYRKKVSP